MFSEGPFLCFLLVFKGFEVAPARGSPASVNTMSWPAMLASKLNMSGLDFLALVLRSSNSLHLNAFFQVLFSLIGSVCRGNDNLLPSESLRSIIFFVRGRESFFCSFFGLKLQTVSPLNPCFQKVLFCTFSVMLILWVFACALEPHDYH